MKMNTQTRSTKCQYRPAISTPCAGVLPMAGADGRDDQDDEAGEDVRAVEAREHEEGLRELAGRPPSSLPGGAGEAAPSWMRCVHS